MSRAEGNSPIYWTEEEIKHYAKVITYPCGVADIMACSDAIFGAKGWENADAWGSKKVAQDLEHKNRRCADPAAEDLQRSMRRARAKVRRLALANDFRYFVTLTLDPMKVDRESGEAVVKKLNAWCSNMVQRKGLRYILVPEYHKKGGIHFHGFFNDALEAIDSGHSDRQGHRIYNLPGWTLGFTTAIELYDDYVKAVSYVCKYIGKQGTKPAGRWYYSGGDLSEPQVTYATISPATLEAEYGSKAISLDLPGKKLVVVNGIVLDQVQKGD